ncbi:MAG: hypothetical protein J0H08_11035 [Rhizobiales bacterium]|nr:hypothetical protein [Hyphomicrobiales bacterium]
MTVLKFLFLGAALVAGTMFLPSESRGSEWGCQVLLCLSGDWQGTPSCHPPIYKLIAAMDNLGFHWPTCPQANSSSARYEPYEDCPAGWTAFAPATSEHGGRSEQSMCRVPDSNVQQIRNGQMWNSNGSLRPGGHNDSGMRTATIQIEDKTVQARVRTASNGGHGFDTTTYYEIARPRRAKPYYIEYDDANGARQRSWFSLK